MARRTLIALALVAAALHAWAIARTQVPAQDGLKFLRAARSFGANPWIDAIRGTDQHPLYPMLVACVRPIVALMIEPGPDAERVAAQTVSAAASIATLVPLYFLASALFDCLIARLACLLFVALPLPAEVGHDCLSDSLGLFFAVSTLCLGEFALRTRGRWPALACGVCAGVGYWARPEVVLAAAAVAMVAAIQAAFELRQRSVGWCVPRPSTPTGAASEAETWRPTVGPRLATLCAVVLATSLPIGSYAIAKGQLSEKLSVRLGVGLCPGAERPQSPPSRGSIRNLARAIPPKEEAASAALRSPGPAISHIAGNLVRVMGVLLVPLALVGMIASGNQPGHVLLKVYLFIFFAVLIRHVTTFGYGSYRHVLSVAVVSLPWAAWRLAVLGRRLARWFQLPRPVARGAGALACFLILASGIVAQGKAVHPSRWGHWAAGQWIGARARPQDAVLDTHGWAALHSGCRSYDMWHVGQALSDSRLRYLVVEASEIEATTERGRALRALVAERARFRPVAAFPARRGDSSEDVLIFETGAIPLATEGAP